jgi:hypothetical protein
LGASRLNTTQVVCLHQVENYIIIMKFAQLLALASVAFVSSSKLVFDEPGGGSKAEISLTGAQTLALSCDGGTTTSNLCRYEARIAAAELAVAKIQLEQTYGRSIVELTQDALGTIDTSNGNAWTNPGNVFNPDLSWHSDGPAGCAAVGTHVTVELVPTNFVITDFQFSSIAHGMGPQRYDISTKGTGASYDVQWTGRFDCQENGMRFNNAYDVHAGGNQGTTAGCRSSGSNGPWVTVNKDRAVTRYIKLGKNHGCSGPWQGGLRFRGYFI